MSKRISIVNDKIISEVEKELMEKYADADTFRIKRGVRQVASFWTDSDGSIDEYKKFCTDNFIDSESELENTFEKISRNIEILSGNMNRIILDLKVPLDLDVGEIKNVDVMFGSYNPGSHLEEDFYRNKIAFYILLNFPFYTLEEKYSLGENWSRKDWAYARLGDYIISRVPSDIIQEYSEILTNTDSYIAEYNIYMGKVINDKSETMFPEDLKLISHWGLRDELKSHYNSDNGLEKQKMIFQIMNRIISQEIPEEVINSDKYRWNPYTNELFEGTEKIDFSSEPDTRYQKIIDIFNGVKKYDPYFPGYPDNIKREFELNMEIPQKEVEDLFIELMSSEQVRKAGELISKRLGRKLEPFDIWYNGFGSEKRIPEEELNKLTRAKYSTSEDFRKDIPSILTHLGFTNARADYIASKITVDASRGAGHAWGAQMRTDKAHLRTRVEKGGMNYKGYNIAIHELGHNVEQTLSLYDVDHYLLNGVPNTAFTEALAFIFQKRDLEILGVGQKAQYEDHMMALNILWTGYEIMGVSLVDMYVWKWLYDNPDATASQLKEAVISISKDVWNKYYAEIFGVKDQAILAIYSHMVTYPLYLSAYPVGQLIQFQIEKYMEDKSLADEIQRVFTLGRLTPQMWMKQAVGTELSCTPLLESAEEALTVINQ
ncbi:MAG: hypothetical protein JSV22_13690 [Bacteroidales bacterium]|nr:MAG: hypothetical protein JSV22_13690 [Bacteroidales bacterium]